ncbi:PilZ domain-containing protein [Hippea sp. KM1]|uniref:PilZ domain-containing protein n=1 Tax=Hippea sp. KM1 TaxID=944481 RepID=UPI00046D7F05|nr:PilZ domain-containing protein [Hippea sp. KM1]
MDNKRRDRRIKNRVVIYYKKLKEDEVESVKEEIYNRIEPEDSFSFFASLYNMDSRFGDLNKAFVLIMKEMDAKLNYIIELLRGDNPADTFKGFERSETCDLSSYGLSFKCGDCLEGDVIYGRVFLPIASHYAIKLLGRIVRVGGDGCVGMDIEHITAADRELIIHYMVYFERKLAKSKLNEQ